MHILHVLGERGYSGGEVQLAHLLTHLQAAGHDTTLVLQPGAAFAHKAAVPGATTVVLRMRTGFDPLAAWSLRRILRRTAPDLVHLADARAHKLGALATVAGARPPMVVTRRIAKPTRQGRRTRWLYTHAVRAVVAISGAVRDSLTDAGVPAERIHVIPDGVEAKRFHGLAERRKAARAGLGLPADALVIACAARLDPAKGQGHLLRALATVRRAHPQACLLLAGEGPERAALQAEVATLGLEDAVHMPGHEDVATVLAAADIACVPSLKEGLSVFALEAQAAALPVVASRVGGLPEAVADGESGLLTAPGDEAALAGALERLLADPALRAQLGAAGRRRVTERFLARDMAARTEALYVQVAGAT